MADYDPLMYAPHAPGAPPPPQQQEPLFIEPHNLVGPRLPPIDDIVANDPEIRRICSELSTFLSDTANNSYVINYVHSFNSYTAYNPHPSGPPALSINEYRYKPTDTLFYPTTFIEPVKFFVRNAIKPNSRQTMYNPQAEIATLENSLNNTLSDANIGRAGSSDVSSRGPYMSNTDHNQHKKSVYRSVQIPAGITHLMTLYDILLRPGEGMIELNTARQYVNLILQLYRRIQTILVENGFQQGGKKKKRRQTKTKRKRRQTKKRRTYKNK